jgi:hypothetical protein
MALVHEDLLVCHGNTSYRKVDGRLLRRQKPPGESVFVKQIAAQQFLHQLVPIQLTDHASGIVVVGDIGGIFGEQIAYDLIDGVVTLLAQGIEHTPENSAHILFVIAGNGKFQGFTIRHGLSLLKLKIHGYYSPKILKCKDLN